MDTEKAQDTQAAEQAPARLTTPAWVYVAAGLVSALVWAPWFRGIGQWDLSLWLPNILGWGMLFAFVSFPLLEWLYWLYAPTPGGVRAYPIARNILLIAGRELRSHFNGGIAYGVMFFLLAFSGLIFTFVVWDSRSQADVAPILQTVVFLSLMVSPLLTMGTLAQERSSGTIEMLMTKPVRDSELVVGKYLAVLGLYLGAIAVTFVYVAFLATHGDLDWGRVFSGYLGLALCGAAFLALGVLASSLVSSQVAAAALGYCFTLLMWLIGWVGMSTKGWVSQVFDHLSVLQHFLKMSDGTIDTRSLVFFFALIIFALFMAIRCIESRRTV